MNLRGDTGNKEDTASAPIGQRGPHKPISAPLSPVGRYVRRGLEVCLLIAVLVGVWYVMTGGWKLVSQDVDEYFRYAHAFWLEHPRFRSLPTEYPPLAIIPFSVTLLPSSIDHHVVFAMWMGLLVLVGYAGYVRYSTRQRAVTWMIYLLLGTTAVVLARYDLVPALVTLAAVWAAQRSHYRLGYGLLGVGILLKLYPGFLLPVMMVAEWRELKQSSHMLPAGNGRWHVRGHRLPLVSVGLDASVGVLLALVGFGVSFVLSPHGTMAAFRYALDRPLQAESTPASLMWLGSVLGVPMHAVFSFGAYNAVGPLDAWLKPLSSLALVGGCCWVYWRQARGQLSLAQATLACLCMVVVTSKLLSAQYLLWVLPFAAEVAGVDALWIAICLLTTLEYPILFDASFRQWTTTYTTPYMLVLAIRNGLLLYVTVQATLGRSLSRASHDARHMLALSSADTPSARLDPPAAISPAPGYLEETLSLRPEERRAVDDI